MTKVWFQPNNSSVQRGGPVPMGQDQARNPPFSLLPPFGNFIQVLTRRFDRGAAAYSAVTGVVTYDPIGDGVVAKFRPPTIMGPAGQYVDGSIFWNVQSTPTSVGLGPLLTPQIMQALLGNTNVQAAVRTR